MLIKRSAAFLLTYLLFHLFATVHSYSQSDTIINLELLRVDRCGSVTDSAWLDEDTIVVSTTTGIWQSTPSEDEDRILAYEAGNAVTAITVNQDKHLLAAGISTFNAAADNAIIRLWDTRQNAILSEVVLDTGNIDSIDISRDGLVIFSGNNFPAQIWDMQSKLIGFEETYGPVAFSSDGQDVIFFSWNGNTHELNIATLDGERKLTVDTGVDNGLRDLTIGDNFTIITYINGNIQHIDMRDGTIDASEQTSGNEYIDVSLSPDASNILYTASDGRLTVVDAISQETMYMVYGDCGVSTPEGLVITGHHSTLLSAWRSRETNVGSLRKDGARQTYDEEVLIDAAFSPDGNYAVVSLVGDVNEVLLIDLESSQTQMIYSVDTVILGAETIDQLIMTNSLILGLNKTSNTIAIWNYEALLVETIGTLSLKTDALVFDYSTQNDVLATIDSIGMVEVWQLNDFTLLETIATSAILPTALQLSPDGQQFAVSNSDGEIQVVAVDGTVIHQLNPQGGAIYAIAFHPSEPLLFAGGFTGRIMGWNLMNGEQVTDIQGHAFRIGAIRQLAFNMDGTVLGTAGQDGSSILWTVEISSSG